MELRYFFWVLLPISFIGLAVWAQAKRWFKMEGKEYPKEHMRQAVFCLLGFILAVYLDKYFIEYLKEGVLFGFETEVDCGRWLLYPAVLLAMAEIQKVVLGERRKVGV